MFNHYKSPSILKEESLKEGGTIIGDTQEVNWEEVPGGLKISLGPNFDKSELEADMDSHGIGAVETDFFDSYARMIGNGWDVVNPEDIGALTNSVIIGKDVDFDDEGKITQAEALYWYPNYQIRSYLEDLLEKGETFFERGDEEEKEEPNLEEGGMYV